ncbi:uncharacterized protein LOC127714125 [Mytilus californianus]|uniref:uncharacterized protein LOC127714125 n=1 Tax=Mytilus californianus TaxID=6549 RepID=UPI00224842BB|nr:uncharacterized protein LOC127714125 [Mytilus californianus]
MSTTTNLMIFVDGVPIVGHVRSMIYYYRGQRKQAVKAFMRATHNTGVTCFGVLGRALTDPPESITDIVAGPVAGGIIGGICVDALISAFNLMCYGYVSYAKKLMNRNFKENDLLDLGKLTFKDGMIGLSAFLVYMIATHVEKQNEINGHILTDETKGHGTEIKCYSNVCETQVITKESGYSRDLGNVVLPLLFEKTQEVKKIKVDNILQLKPGDHIVYERRISEKSHLYDHHAIVGEVLPEEGKYTVYEQSAPSNKNELKLTGKASIKEIEKRFDNKSLYKIDHGKTALSNYEVQKMAHFICHHGSHLDFMKTYNLLFNNCEHFANFCATGQRESYQIQQSTVVGISRDIFGIFRFYYYQLYAIWYFMKIIFSVFKSCIQIIVTVSKGLIRKINQKKRNHNASGL